MDFPHGETSLIVTSVKVWLRQLRGGSGAVWGGGAYDACNKGILRQNGGVIPPQHPGGGLRPALRTGLMAPAWRLLHVSRRAITDLTWGLKLKKAI